MLKTDEKCYDCEVCGVACIGHPRDGELHIGEVCSYNCLEKLEAAQPTLAPDFAETCEYCDKPKKSPNFAYHVCTGRKAGNANR